eukprot:gnl/TRDRNA2_/TRDRNA2_166169_c4_seq1.p1 gnl/TRDRNA2_/TRDRNA2_166169_c4~~gnl/TRDRNA2_/TRDRNA2_166169_c4_seq1.p1  ORF type:complete len:200 (+),score=37.77 gnl/TRDRNA2_/TRDRNA2_166169_c4_seq1:167-766(+)
MPDPPVAALRLLAVHWRPLAMPGAPALQSYMREALSVQVSTASFCRGDASSFAGASWPLGALALRGLTSLLRRPPVVTPARVVGKQRPTGGGCTPHLRTEAAKAAAGMAAAVGEELFAEWARKVATAAAAEVGMLTDPIPEISPAEIRAACSCPLRVERLLRRLGGEQSRSCTMDGCRGPAAAAAAAAAAASVRNLAVR